VRAWASPVSLGEVQVRRATCGAATPTGSWWCRAPEDEVLQTARSIEEAESAIEAETAKGTSLVDARTKHHTTRCRRAVRRADGGVLGIDPPEVAVACLEDPKLA
jgi:hypothetical protein